MAESQDEEGKGKGELTLPVAFRPAGLWTIAFIAFIISALTTVVSVYLYDRNFSQRVYVFDVTNYLDEQKTLFMSRKIDKTELERRLKKVNDTVEVLSKGNVILTKELVIAGGEEIPGIFTP